MSDLTEELTKILFSSSFMTLATSDRDGLPWVTPVEFVCDEAMRFYWVSLVDARHSRNVRANPRAALAIYDSRQTPGVRAMAQGLYAEGSVEELHAADFEAARPSLRRWIDWRDAGLGAPRAPAGADPSGDETRWRQYRLTVTKLYALDPGGHPDFPGVRVWRASVDLTDSFSRAYRSRRG